MKLPLQITFQNLGASEALSTKIRQHADKLERHCDRITSCRVAVEVPHHHHGTGNQFRVRVEVGVPGKKLVANREADEHHANTDAYVAIRDAFDNMRRQLDDYSREQRREVKLHQTPAHGQIVELARSEDHWRIETSDGRSVYFHRNSVIDADFDRLEVGMDVRYDEAMGDQGPQASTVHLIGKHHIVS